MLTRERWRSLTESIPCQPYDAPICLEDIRGCQGPRATWMMG
jgi:hypothetical protein